MHHNSLLDYDLIFILWVLNSVAEIPTWDMNAFKIICYRTGCLHTHLFPHHILLTQKHEIWDEVCHNQRKAELKPLYALECTNHISCTKWLMLTHKSWLHNSLQIQSDKCSAAVANKTPINFILVSVWAQRKRFRIIEGRAEREMGVIAGWPNERGAHGVSSTSWN